MKPKHFIKSAGVLILCLLIPLLSLGQERAVERVVKGANTDIIEYSDGTRHAIVSTAPRNYLDGQGKWQKIDTRIQASAISEYTHTIFKVPYRVRFGNDGVYKFDYAGKYVIYRPEGANSVSPVIEGNKVTYRDLWTDTDVELIANSYGVKENIILKSDKAPISFSFQIETSAKSDLQGDVVLFEDGKFRIPSPNAFNGETAYPVSADLTGGIYTVTVDNKGAVYPIVLDPSTTVTRSGAWGALAPAENVDYLVARNSTTGGVLTVGFDVGHDLISSSHTFRRPFFEFDLSGIASGATASACSLVMDGVLDYSDTDFYVRVCSSNQTGVAATGWFNDFPGWAASGAYSPVYYNAQDWYSSSYSASWNRLKLNSTALDSLGNHFGSAVALKMVLLSSTYDIPGSNPGSSDSWIRFEDSNAYLSFTYSEAASGWTGNISAVPDPDYISTVSKSLIDYINTVP